MARKPLMINVVQIETAELGLDSRQTCLPHSRLIEIVEGRINGKAGKAALRLDNRRGHLSDLARGRGRARHPGVLIVPLETEFGWSRATISFAVGVNILLYGLIGPFAAAVMDRFGLRRTMLAALALIATGVALTPLMTQPWHLVLLWGVIVGTGNGTFALVLGTTVAARWFAVRRGGNRPWGC